MTVRRVLKKLGIVTEWTRRRRGAKSAPDDQPRTGAYANADTEAEAAEALRDRPTMDDLSLEDLAGTRWNYTRASMARAVRAGAMCCRAAVHLAP